MKKYYLIGLLLYCCYSLVGSPYVLATKKEVVPIEISKRLILVKAKLNKQKGYFLFDTGVSGLVLNQQHFNPHNEYNFAHAITDISGKAAAVKHIPVKSFQLGKLSRRNFLAPQLNMDELEGMLGKKLLGLIGYQVVKAFEVIIDYDEKTLTLLDLDRDGLPSVAQLPPADYQFEFQLCRYLPVLKVSFANQQTLRLGLDSGSTLNLVNKSLETAFLPISRSQRTISFKGALSEIRDANYLLMENVAIGNQVAWRFWKAAFEDLSHMHHLNMPIDGLLGINFFRMGKVSINFEKQQIKVWERVNGYESMYFSLN